MRDINQILFLSKNPYYKLLPEEEKALEDFLDKKRAKASKKQQKKTSSTSDDSTPATAGEHGSDTVKVRNIVEKTIPKVEESGR